MCLTTTTPETHWISFLHDNGNDNDYKIQLQVEPEIEFNYRVPMPCCKIPPVFSCGQNGKIASKVAVSQSVNQPITANQTANSTPYRILAEPVA